MVTTTALTWLGETTNRTLVLPLVMFLPTGRCHSRCVSCSWWESTGEDDLTASEIDEVAASLARLGTRLVVFSGGEPLVRRDLFDVADSFRSRGIALHLLTSGIGLRPRAADVAQSFDRVVVSLDAVTDGLYAEIRGIDGLSALEQGVARLRAVAPRLPITARSTIHRRNFGQLPLLIAKARAMGLEGISFLAADVSSAAFGRADRERPRELLLSRAEVRELRALIDVLESDQPEVFASRFVAESPARLRRIAQYYAAMLGDEPFPPVSCNAPWVSAVIEANGDVRPCFFHAPLGNVRRTPLAGIVRDKQRAFRQALNFSTDPTCQRCVCSLKVAWSRAPWN